MTKVPATGSSLDDGLKAYRPCVGIMLINRGGLVWIGRRPSGRAYSNEGGDTWWQMPQGGIDEAEDPARAARRELYEETGITSVGPIAEHPAWLKYDLPPGLAPGSWGGKYRGQRMDSVPDDYWQWLIDNGLEDGPVMDYLETYTDLL